MNLKTLDRIVKILIVISALSGIIAILTLPDEIWWFSLASFGPICAGIIAHYYISYIKNLIYKDKKGKKNET